MAVLLQVFSTWRCASQVDPILAFSFILILEILVLKSNPEIKGLAIFDHRYLYYAYADDTIFFLQDTIPIKHIVDTFFFCTFLD